VSLDPETAATAGLDAPALLAAPVAIYAVDMTGAVCLWNEAAEAMFGWSADEVLGTFPPFILPERLDDAFAALDRVFNDELVELHDRQLRRRDGAVIEVDATASLLRDPSGAPLATLSFVRDVTDLRRAERRRRDAEQKWRRLALQAVDAVSFCDDTGHVVHTTHHEGDALGYPAEWWSGRNGFEVLHPDDVAHAADVWAELASTPRARQRTVLRARHARGHYEQVEFTGLNLLDDPHVGAIVTACRVVSTQMQNERLAADEARVLELVARDAPLDDVWDAVVAMVEYHTGASVGIFLYDDDDPHLRLVAWGALGDELVALANERSRVPLSPERRAVLGEATIVTDFAADLRTRPWGPRVVEAGFRGAWTQPIAPGSSSTVRGLLAVFVTDERQPTTHERKVAALVSQLVTIALERSYGQQELRRRARFDELTGLPNRTAIFEHLDACLAEARVQRVPVTAMVIDLDRFKLVNDSLGHDCGDELLERLAERLRAIAGERDFVGRMAADEFVVLFAPGVRLREAKLVARGLAKALDEPFHLGPAAGTAGGDDGWPGEDVHLTASVGLAMSNLGRENADTLLQRADAAMFRAKALGRDRVEIYDERLRSQVVTRLEIDRELRVALEQGELLLHYQPEIDCATGRIVGAEALLRWQHRTKGLIHPEGFITVAEESGSIVPIGHWVLDEAVRQARTWTDAHPAIEPFMVSVNISARQLVNRSLVDAVAFVLTRYDWPPSNLTLELTESILIEDRDATLYVLNRLRLLGVKLAIDDFGTGFASLDYLHRLHVDWIKIDRSFVRMLDAEGNGSPVATAMTHMARAFELGIIAEGVEEQRQLDGLQALGCDVLQGFLFAEPLPPDDLEALLP
jgi:diguanylate cyclase (GGDEF)-like protein/PAS domain S-box-containing protein